MSPQLMTGTAAESGLKQYDFVVPDDFTYQNGFKKATGKETVLFQIQRKYFTDPYDLEIWKGDRIEIISILNGEYYYHYEFLPTGVMIYYYEGKFHSVLETTIDLYLHAFYHNGNQIQYTGRVPYEARDERPMILKATIHHIEKKIVDYIEILDDQFEQWDQNTTKEKLE